MDQSRFSFPFFSPRASRPCEGILDDDGEGSRFLLFLIFSCLANLSPLALFDLASLRRPTASNPDVTAPLSVSLEQPHGQCSLFLYMRAFHRALGSRPAYTFPFGGARRRGCLCLSTSFFLPLYPTNDFQVENVGFLLSCLSCGFFLSANARHTGRTATTTRSPHSHSGRYAAGSTSATPGVAMPHPRSRLRSATPTPTPPQNDAGACVNARTRGLRGWR